MFKSSRRKAVKAKEKVTFKLEFHASRVPQRGWDKLLVSLVSLDTGKVKAKTGKVPVKNGTCQWTEPLFESTYISEESNGKDANKELYKLVVSMVERGDLTCLFLMGGGSCLSNFHQMGLSRFGILGEITIKLVDYLQTAVPISLPLPLQNCNFGSILHVKIQRIMPKSASGELEDQKEVTLDQDLKLPTSDGGQQTESDSVLPAGDSVADSGQGKPPTENKVDACPMSTSSHSFDSVDVPSTPGVSESHLYGRDGLGDEELMSLSSSASSSGRHEAVSGFYDNNQESMSEFTSTEMLPKPSTSVDSYSSSPYYSKSSPGGNNKQNEEWNKLEWGLPDNSSSLFHGTESYDDTNSQRQTCLQRTGSVATATSWKPDGNQMAVAEIEALKQQLADETRTSEEVHKKLSLLIAERDSIKQEMENLKSLEKSPSSKAREGGLKWQQQVEEDASRRNVEELQDELDYATSMNSNLSFQLRKTQESNSELLLEIQDLEKLLQEKQLDIQANENKPESGGRRIEDTDKDLIKLVDTLQKQLEELERDSQELTEENLVLTSQLKQANDNLKDKDDIIAQLDIKSTCISNADSIAELEADKLGDDLKEKLRASEEARVLLERQSQGLQEKATRAEHDYRNALEIIKELEAANRKLEKEKGEAIITLEKQLKEAEKQVLVAVRNYDDVLQVMGGMKAETIELDREMSILLAAKEEVDASRSQLQNINAMLEDQLHQEQLKTSKVFQQSQENDSQFHQALNAAQAQTKSMEQIITELQSVRKELESEVKDLQEENKLSRSRIKELELHGAALEDETHSLKAARSVLEAEMQDLKSLKERFKSQEEAMIRWKQSKAGMEEKISHLQEANVKGSRRPLEEINSEFNELLQKQTSDLTRKLSEKEMEQKELKTRVFYLEEELQRKVNALSFAEKKLKEQREPFANDGSSQVSYFTRSLSRANSRIGSKSTIPPSREAKELSDLRDKVKLLEGEVKRKAAELEVSKQQLKEQHTQLSIRIEHLELANEELVKEHSNSNLDQALKELNSLQNQNAILFQRENDLLVRLSSQEALQSEMEILKEEKKELERALLKFNAAAKGENILKRISTLETELAEVLEANIMYKSQLQSAFAKQQNVHAAALENLGSVDQVIKDLAELKRKNLLLEDELCDMRERYFNMSLQFAEVEGEREELVMTIRNLRGTKKLMPYRSANF